MKIFKFNYAVIIFCLAYLVCSPFYLYQVSSDTVSYIAISENYLDGNWYAAVNGYWSPLLSIILIPFIYFHVDPLLGIKIICFLSSLLIFYSFKKLSSLLKLEIKHVGMGLYFLAPLLLWRSLSLATPDLMATSLLLLFLTKVLKTRYSSFDYIVISFLGVLCYLGKYYNFYFIALAFLTRCIIFRNGNQIKELSITMGLFTIICSIWFACLYAKYNKFAPSTASTYNLYMGGPDAAAHKNIFHGERGLLLNYLDYSKYRYTSWEDPTYYRGEWNPFESFKDFKHYMALVFTNLMQLFYSLAVFISAIMILCTTYKKNILSVFTPKIVLVSLLAVLYPIGYVMIHFEGRYIIFTEVLLLFLLIYISAKLPPTKKLKIITTTMFGTLIAIYSFLLISQVTSKGVESSKVAAKTINKNVTETVLYSTPSCWRKALFISFFSKKIKFHDAVDRHNLIAVPEKEILLVGNTAEISQIPPFLPTKLIYSSKDISVVRISKPLPKDDYPYIYR